MNIPSSSRAVTTQAAVLGAALALSVFQPAFANDGEPTKVVRFADLDLTRPAGAETLYRRIRLAAREVCRAPILDRHWTSDPEKACFQRAIDRAVDSVGSPLLTRLHGDRVIHLVGR